MILYFYRLVRAFVMVSVKLRTCIKFLNVDFDILVPKKAYFYSFKNQTLIAKMC